MWFAQDSCGCITFSEHACRYIKKLGFHSHILKSHRKKELHDKLFFIFCHKRMSLLVLSFFYGTFVSNVLSLFFRYDHLSNCLTKILDERPENVYDVFEDISKDAKRSRFTSNVDTVQDKIDQSTEVALAQVQKKLFSVSTKMF